MSDYSENFKSEYFPLSETRTLETVDDKENHDLVIEEQKYGINKPSRIIIKAKISHGKN